jgi:hypothetical protein
MVERTTKMTESHRVVGVCGRSARSGPHRLDWGAAWTGGAGQHGARAGARAGANESVTLGACGSTTRTRSVARGWAGSIGWLGGLGNGSIGPSPRVMNIMYVCIYIHILGCKYIFWLE